MENNLSQAEHSVTAGRLVSGGQMEQSPGPSPRDWLELATTAKISWKHDQSKQMGAHSATQRHLSYASLLELKA